MEKWLRSYFSKNDVPNWACPTCKEGRLIIVQEEFHFEETSTSVSEHSDNTWGREMIVYRFHGTLKKKKI